METIGNYAFQGCTSYTRLTIPASVTDIGERAFYNNTGLLNLTIENGNIGKEAFRSCISLTNLTLRNVKTINEYAFYGTVIKNIDLGNKLERIDKYAFSNSVKITELTIPKSVKYIGTKAFYYEITTYPVTDITISVYIRPTSPPTIDDGLFCLGRMSNSNGQWNQCLTLYVPTESIDAYNSIKSKFGQTGYITIIGYDYE